MLTDLLLVVPVILFAKLAQWLGVHDGLHEWMPGFCPCEATA